MNYAQYYNQNNNASNAAPIKPWQKPGTPSSPFGPQGLQFLQNSNTMPGFQMGGAPPAMGSQQYQPQTGGQQQDPFDDLMRLLTQQMKQQVRPGAYVVAPNGWKPGMPKPWESGDIRPGMGQDQIRDINGRLPGAWDYQPPQPTQPRPPMVNYGPITR
jgi:hypothetical protein